MLCYCLRLVNLNIFVIGNRFDFRERTNVKNILYIATLLIVQNICAHEFPFDQKINALDSLDGKALEQAVAEIYETLELEDYKTRLDVSLVLAEKTSEKGGKAHIYSLCLKAIYADTVQPHLFDLAYKNAAENHWIDMQYFVEERKSYFFLERQQYDSAMVYLLRMRDNKVYKQINADNTGTMHMLADIYFKAGLYSKALPIYQQIYDSYRKKSDWNNWRSYVVMSNMGIAALLLNNFDMAAIWFQQVLDTAEKHLHQPYKSNILAYNHIKLAESQWGRGHDDAAWASIEKVLAFDSAVIQEDVWQEYHYLKAKIFFSRSRYDEALQEANRLVAKEHQRFHHYRFVPEVYWLISEIYAAKGAYQQSYSYARKYYIMADSIQSQHCKNQSMIILADRDYEMAMEILGESRQRFWVLLGFFVVVLMGAIIIGWLYVGLYNSKMMLVRRSVEDLQNVEEEIKVISESHAEVESKEPDLTDIAAALTKLLEKDKIYKSPQVNIQDVAKMIGTNRTYLSKAINRKQKTSFPNLINRYRINHAILLIRSGYTLNHTQDSLAKECGFASVTVFITAFKKEIGVLPSFFIKNYLKSDS